MAKQNWTLDQLKKELSSRSDVKGWVVTQEHVRRRERYFMLDGSALVTDQDRDVQQQNMSLRLFVKLPIVGRQGEISKKLFPALPLPPQLDSAIEAARQTNHQAWELPTEIPSKLPHLATTDPKIGEDINRVMGDLTSRIEKAVLKPRETQFNSAELFISLHDREMHLSNGLVHRSSQSRIYNEAAYSFSTEGADGKIHSDEYLNARWSVALEDLPIEKIFDETSERASQSLDTRKPETGKYPVIVDADVLATLFNSQISQLSSRNSYHGLPFVKPGDDLVPGASADKLTISLDPTLTYGADTAAVSEQGLLQAPFKLVDQNRVIATSTDKRYSDYLTLPTTTVRGNVVVEPGTLSHRELTKQGLLVIEILQFSGLFVDGNSGTFSSEIRLAKLYDNRKGTVSFMKGGSLSGSFKENFKGARLSREKAKRAHFSSNQPQGEGYYGPEYALLSEVSIVG